MSGSIFPSSLLDRWNTAINAFDPIRVGGRVVSSRGLMLTCKLNAALNDRCEILTGRGTSCLAEVVGFTNDLAYLFLYENSDQVRPNMPVVNLRHGVQTPTGPGLLGRVIDGIARPIDERGPVKGCRFRTLELTAPSPLQRTRIRDVFMTNQRAIDGLLTCGRGQRIAIFSGSGVGKSTLLGEIAKGSNSQINVIALIGERGSEVKPFIEDCLGEGLKKSIVVVATSDDPPLMRVRAASPWLSGRSASRSASPPAHAATHLRYSSFSPTSSSAWATRPRVASPACSRCSSTATISTNRSPTLYVPMSTGTSCSIADSRKWGTSRRSASARASAASCTT
jgi:hypothetical protein